MPEDSSIDRDLVLKMSPATHFHEHISDNRKRDTNGGNNNRNILKINKDSHLIKKSSSSSTLPPSSSSSSATSSAKPQPQPQQQRRHHPVIIYTHSPKVIHTHPRDFMALVQKLTGLSRSDDNPPRPKPDPDTSSSENKNQKAADDNDSSSSVVTDENCGSTIVGNVKINSCFPAGTHHHPRIFVAPNPCFSNIPSFNTNSCDFLCPAAAQPFYNNYAESLLLMPSMRTSISSASSSALEAKNEFREF